MYDVLLPKGTKVSEAVGQALRYSIREERFHVVGTLIVIHQDNEAHFAIGIIEELPEAYREQIDRRIEHITGYGVLKGETEPTQGSFIFRSLGS